jgi:hypothetical protein
MESVMHFFVKFNLNKLKINQTVIQHFSYKIAFYGTLESIRDLAGKLIFRFRHSYVILEK